jgi:hypothetical protein
MCREYKKMLIIADLKNEKIKLWDEINFSNNNLIFNKKLWKK